MLITCYKLAINLQQPHAARATRAGQIERTSAGAICHAAAHGNAAAPHTETDGARKPNGKKYGSGTGSGIGIAKGNGTGTGNNNRNWNYRLLHRKTKIGAESGTLTAPKNKNPDGTENGADRRRYAPKNKYGAKLCKITKCGAIYLYNIPSCKMTLYLLYCRQSKGRQKHRKTRRNKNELLLDA